MQRTVHRVFTEQLTQKERWDETDLQLQQNSSRAGGFEALRPAHATTCLQPCHEIRTTNHLVAEKMTAFAVVRHEDAPSRRRQSNSVINTGFRVAKEAGGRQETGHEPLGTPLLPEQLTGEWAPHRVLASVEPV